MELSFRGRIGTVKEPRKRPLPERLIEVIDDRNTGEALLDEALKLIKTDTQSIADWIDLMSGGFVLFVLFGFFLHFFLFVSTPHFFHYQLPLFMADRISNAFFFLSLITNDT
jgi:hypothetical protein